MTNKEYQRQYYNQNKHKYIQRMKEYRLKKRVEKMNRLIEEI